MVWLRLVHILAGSVWVGSAVYIAVFLLPTARAAGAEGGGFVARLAQRTGPALGVAMLLTVVSGFLMYGRLSAGFNRAWVTSRPGLALAAGAVAAILAVVVGAGVNGPAARRMTALRKTLAAHGGAPTAAQAAALVALQSRLGRGAQLTSALLVLAAAAMATARYL